jgi:hypothetical protein
MISGEPQREHAVMVLTQLVQYGYPAPLVVRSVSVLSGDWRVLDLLERLRRIDGISLSEALDALARTNGQGFGIDHAEQLLRASDISDDNGRGAARETSGPRGPRSGKGHS